MSNIKPIEFYNLLLINPVLCKEWDYEKNELLTPDKIKSFSLEKVWWTCSKGHSWKTAVKYRTEGRNCPYCSNPPKRVCEKTCLATKSKYLTNEWDYKKNNKLTPYNVMSNSNKKVWWICKNGHESYASPNSRIDHQICSCCSLEENCLTKKYPEVAAQWDIIKNENLMPDKVNSKSKKKVWWICSKSHSWRAVVQSRTEGCNCPYCSNQKVCIDNCLATLNPELVKEWHPTKNGNLTPKDVVAGTHRKVWWKCKKNHEWQAAVVKRVNGNCCPLCDKVILKNGTVCDSLPEAIICLNYLENGIEFLHNKRYHKDFGGHRYDFYIPKENKYVEVTAFRMNSQTVNCFTYLRKIVKKKRFVENILKANFEFIQFTPTKEQIDKLRKYIV